MKFQFIVLMVCFVSMRVSAQDSYDKDADIASLLEKSQSKVLITKRLRQIKMASICAADLIIDLESTANSALLESLPFTGFANQIRDRVKEDFFDGKSAQKQRDLIKKYNGSYGASSNKLITSWGGGILNTIFVGGAAGFVDTLEWLNNDRGTNHSKDFFVDEVLVPTYSKSIVTYGEILSASEKCKAAKLKAQAASEAYDIVKAKSSKIASVNINELRKDSEVIGTLGVGLTEFNSGSLKE